MSAQTRHWCVALCAAAVWCTAAAAAETKAGNTPPGGRREIRFELDGKWIGNGVSFSPYRDGQKPGGALPTDAQILADLRLVVRYWNLIRMYDSSEVAERTLALIRREKLPLRMILGAWILPEAEEWQRAANRRESEGAIRLANAFPDIVIGVNVGNEACVGWSGHRSGPGVVLPWIRMVRQAVKQPVTTADDYSFWNTEPARAVVAEVDFIILHAYALWNSRQLEEAMTWTASIYDSIERMYPGVPVVYGETGWPTSYDPTILGPGGEGTKVKGKVSVEAQQFYLQQHYAWVHRTKVPTILFEAFDENWKGSGETGSPREAEKHWGVFTADRKPKTSFEAIIREFYQR